MVNAFINELLIMGTVFGVVHHLGLRVIFEIQFGDYSLNMLYWFVYVGNLYWGSVGCVFSNIMLWMFVDFVSGGAIYYFMSVDGFFILIQGWIIVCFSIMFDVYGLLRIACDFEGFVLCLEFKILYCRVIGFVLFGEFERGDLKSI